MTGELQPKLWSEEPIRQSAQLLRRVGFLLLFIAVPALAPYSRRSLPVFGTIGAALIVLAAVVEGNMNWKRLAASSLPLSTFFVASLAYLFWSGLSLAWTPFPGESGGRYAAFVTIIFFGFVVTHLLPERVGASRLYSLSGGVAIGWIMALGVSFAPEAEIDQFTLQKSIILLILLLPPTIVWLIYRRRDVLAFTLVLLAGITVVWLQNIMMSAALLTSLIVFLFALAAPDRTRKILSIGFAAIILLAPFIPILVSNGLEWIMSADDPVLSAFENWTRIILDEPFRLLTGHGFDTILRAEKAGLIPSGSPHGLLIDIWYELGIIGAVALAAMASMSAKMTVNMTRPSAAALMAIVASALVMGSLGGNLPQNPWLTSLALAAFSVVAIERGLYKTARPRSRDIALLNQQKPRFSIVPDWLRF